MKKYLFFVLALIFSCICLKADQIIGCPNGLGENMWWIKAVYRYEDADEKWSSRENGLIDISEGTGLKKKLSRVSSLRLGYGITERLDIGITGFYGDGEIIKINQNGTVYDYESSNMQSVWVSGKYILSESFHSNRNHIKVSLGAAYGFSLITDTEDLNAGLDSGADRAKIGILAHGGLWGVIGYSTELLYHWRGNASDDPCFSRAGQDMPDSLDYVFKLERELGDYISLGLALTGYFGMEKDYLLLDSDGVSLKPYRHHIMIMVEILPLSVDYEKCKFAVQAILPYSTRTLSSYECALQTILMWTF